MDDPPNSKIYFVKSFRNFRKEVSMSDRELIKVALEVESGLYDADLGSGLIKKRMAAPGQGKSGGYRLILAVRKEDRIIFLHGFRKNNQSNLNTKELKYLRSIGLILLNLNDRGLSRVMEEGEIIEVKNNENRT